MKNKNLFFLLLAGMFAFTACSDEASTIINDLTDEENNEITFVLHAPNNNSYVLIADNANSIIDILTCEQPDYGFPAGVTYTVDICESGKGFEEFASLASTGYGEKVLIKTSELNDAMSSLGMSNEKESYSVDIRLRAFVNDKIAVLKSNTVTMALTPYIDARGRTPVYFVGSIFKTNWNNNDPTMILFADDDTDDMQYTYTGFVEKDSEFKIIRELGSYNAEWGAGDAAGELVTKGGHNIIACTADGYYTISLDLADNKYTIERLGTTPTRYDQLSLVGNFNGWGEDPDLDLTRSSYDDHIWVNEKITIPSDGELKIRVDHDWTTSFGGSNGLWKEKQGEFAVLDGGDNIKVKAGTYFLKFNDITKHLILISK